MGVVAIFLFRFYLGYLFGGTQDQHGYIVLWDLINNHRNPYTDCHTLVWPPFWWISLGLWGALWHLLLDMMPSIVGPLEPSLFLKLLYYIFELLTAFILAKYIIRADSPDPKLPLDEQRFMKIACIFLLLPATWIITSLHGNFDSIPAFLVIFAFLLLEFETTETSALFASALLGLAVMARTFPAIFVFILLVHIFRRFRWTTGVFAGVLCAAPSFLSLYPLYLMNPDVVVSRLSYQGISGGWWNIAGLARLLKSEQLSKNAFELNYPIFYLAMLLLILWLSWELWAGRIRIMYAGLVIAVGLFCLAPTISNQNFYFLIPWAFWCAMTWKQTTARIFLWYLCVNLALIYIVLPSNLEDPMWFQPAYDFLKATHQEPIPSPLWLVKTLAWTTSVLKRDGLDYNPFIQLLLRMPLWIILWIWFISILKHKDNVTSKPLSLPPA